MYKQYILSLYIVGLALFLGGCDKKTEKPTPVQVKAKVDSLFRRQEEEIRQQAAEDLDMRRAIEVKAKADSLFRVYKGDTIHQEKEENVPVHATHDTTGFRQVL